MTDVLIIPTDGEFAEFTEWMTYKAFVLSETGKKAVTDWVIENIGKRKMRKHWYADGKFNAVFMIKNRLTTVSYDYRTKQIEKAA